MPSNENNTPDKKTEKETNVTKFEATKAAKPKKKLGFGWWLGMIVLILIAITFVLPTGAIFTGGASKNELVFGKYGKENITFTYGNYFYDQYQNLASQYSNSGLSGTQAAYQIWWNAFQNTVLYTAVNQMAKEAGIITADEVVNQAIIDSGVYNKDGKFDTATYNAASAEYKAQINRQIRNAVPFNIVLNDVASVLSSKAEADYVGNMAASTRTFDYVTFGADRYPDDLAIQYAMNDPQQFIEIDLSVIIMSNEDAAKQVADQITAGTLSFEDAAAQYNEDTSLGADGKLGEIPYYSIAMNFSNPDDANTLFSTAPGTVIGPYPNPYGYYTIYRVDAAPTAPDFDNPNTVLSVKQYLAMNQSDTVTAYLLEQATAFSEAAQKDFNAAMDEFNVSVTAVSAAPENFGNSSFMSTLANSDPNGVLAATAANDKEVMKQLYTAEVGTVTGPLKSGSSYVVAEITGEDISSGMSNYVTMFYDYMSGSQNQQDMAQAIFASDKFQNDFINVFFTKILATN